jgi:hypothetical protein
MATKDGFDPDDSLPLFLAADEPEQGIGNDRAAVISLRTSAAWKLFRRSVFVMASILVATATATGISFLSVGNRVTLFANVTASPADKSAPLPSTDQSTPVIQSVVIQSTADAEALPAPVQDVPAREINASEPASQTQETDEASSEARFWKFQARKAEQDSGASANPRTKKENDEASLVALFREFQAWKAEQDARDLAKPAQDDPASVAKDALTSVRSTQKHRSARTMRNARAEMIRHVRERRANVRRQNERVQARPVQDARAQTRSVQYPEPPSFLESLNPFGASSLLR